MIKRRSPTQQVFRVVATFAAVALIHFIGAATAQTPVRQIKLTEEQVQNFLAAKKGMVPLVKKMQGSTADQPDPKLQAESEADRLRIAASRISPNTTMSPPTF